MSALRLIGTGLLVWLSGLPARGQAPSYTFTKIAETGEQFGSFSSPTINAKGQVAFAAGKIGGGGGIYVGDGGALTTIAETGERFKSLPLPPPVNGSGRVAFYGELQSGATGIFAGNGGPVATIAETGGTYERVAGTVAIDDSGRVLFRADLKGGGNGIFAGSGGPVSAVYDSKTGPFRWLGEPSVSPKGVVAFNAEPDGICVGNPAKVVVRPGKDVRGYSGTLYVNDSGTVAFSAQRDTVSRSVMKADGKALVTVVDDYGPFQSAGPAGINAAGTVAFHGKLKSGPRGVFTGPDPVADKVITDADRLLGAPVKDLTLGGLNDAGQLAILATREDNHRVIVRADPIRGRPVTAGRGTPPPARSADAPRYVVLAASEEAGGVPRGEFRGLLVRELVRQTFLSAARDGLGLITRDAALGESAPAGAPAATFAMDFTFNGVKEVRLTLRRTDTPGEAPLPFALPLGMGEDVDYRFISGFVGMGGFDTFRDYLKRAGLRGEPNPVKADGGVTEGTESLLRDMNVMAQYAAVRALHKSIRADGESPERLGALARAYANLGSHTEFYWHPMPKVFQARALAYAERAIRLDHKSPWGFWSRAYALALAGNPASALGDLEIAEGRRRFGRLNAPGWLELIRAYCRYDAKALADARPAAALAPLADWLRFLSTENSVLNGQIEKAGLAVLEKSPEAYRVYQRLTEVGQINIVHRVSVLNLSVLSATLDDRLRALPGVPPEAVGGPKSVEGEVAAVRALAKAGEEDDSFAPSWSALATALRELRFTQVQARLRFMRRMWGVPTDEFWEAAEPLVAGHRYRAFLECYGIDLQRSYQAYLSKLKTVAVDKNDVMLTADTMLKALQEAGVVAPRIWAMAHADHTEADLIRLSDAANKAVKPEVARRMLRVCPGSPVAIGELITRDWEAVSGRAAAWEKEGADQPNVLLTLAYQYGDMKRWDDAERCLRAVIRISPDFRVYQQLAKNYKAQGRRDEWKATLDEFLQNEERGLEHATVRVEIARDLMARGEYKAAWPYAEAAAQTWAAWAMLCAADCAEGLDDWENAELWIRQYADRYNDPLTWYLWCKRLGRGDVATARAQMEAQKVNNPGPANPWLDAIIELLENRNHKAIEILKKGYAETQRKGQGFLLAVLADEAGDRALRDQTWASLVAASSQEGVGGQMGRLAAVFRGSLAQGDGGTFDKAALDAVLKSVDPVVVADSGYYLGRFLELRGRRSEAIGQYRRCLAATGGNPPLRVLASIRLRALGAATGPKREEKVGDKVRD